MILLLHETDDVVVARPARPRERIAARLHAHRLDAELAAGADPERSAQLALRAGRLTARRQRKLLALGLVRAAALRPSAREEALELAHELVRPGPVAARGVAEIAQLLTDGGGPVHSRRGDLRGALERACHDLELPAT